MGFDVQPDGLSDAVTEMRRLEAWWEQSTARLDQLMEHLHLVWHGGAASEQRQAHQRWREGSEKMHDALARLSTAGQQAHRNYTAAGDAGQSMWGVV